MTFDCGKIENSAQKATRKEREAAAQALHAQEAP